MTEKELQLNNKIDSLENKLDFLINLIQSGSFSSAPKTETLCTMTFGEWLDKWYKLYKEPKNKANSLRSMKNYITENIVPELGNIPLSALDGLKLQEFINSIDKGNTRNKISLIVNGSLQKATNLRMISYNPYSSVDIKKHKSTHYIPLEFDVQNRLLNAITNKLYQNILWVMICTGMRPSEFLALDFEKNVDYKNMTIYICETVDIKTGIKTATTKTECGMRYIPFTNDLIPYLKYLQNYIKTVKPINYNMLKCFFRKQYDKLKIDGANIYSFRHSFASMCYYVGMREKQTQTILGHSNLDITLNIYTHILKNGNSPFLDYIRGLNEHLKNC